MNNVEHDEDNLIEETTIKIDFASDVEAEQFNADLPASLAGLREVVGNPLATVIAPIGATAAARTKRKPDSVAWHCVQRPQEKVAVILKLQEGCWYANGEGDPPRTLVEANAKQFDSMGSALAALDQARKCRDHIVPEPFPDAEILDTFL